MGRDPEDVLTLRWVRRGPWNDLSHPLCHPLSHPCLTPVSPLSPPCLSLPPYTPLREGQGVPQVWGLRPQPAATPFPFCLDDTGRNHPPASGECFSPAP